MYKGRSTHSAHYYTKKTIRAINTCQDVFFTLSFQNYQNRGEFSMILCIFCGKPSFISLQMKPDYKHRVPAGPFQITEAVQHRVLEQHASQLLLDFKMSVFADIGAIFGIICMRTSVCILHSICPIIQQVIFIFAYFHSCLVQNIQYRYTVKPQKIKFYIK